MNSKVIISLLCIFTGIMIAIQFNSLQEPKERDTRDSWEIREALQDEQKTQQTLYQQLARAQETLDKYIEESENEQVSLLKQSIEELEEKAGVVEKTGKGVVIDVTPIFIDDPDHIQTYPNVSPALLNRLINELNSFGATDITIANERIVNATPIRLVNGTTYINNRALPSVPFQIKVLANNPSRLFDYFQVSQSMEDFFMEDLELTAHVKSELTMPAFEDIIRLDGVEIYEQKE